MHQTKCIELNTQISIINVDQEITGENTNFILKLTNLKQIIWKLLIILKKTYHDFIIFLSAPYYSSRMCVCVCVSERKRST